MSNVKRYYIQEYTRIQIPLLKDITYISDELWIDNGYLTLFASLDKPFYYDGCSPKWIWRGKIYGTFDGGDRMKYPTLVHDLLYKHQPCSRKLADKVLYWLSTYPFEVKAGGYKLYDIKWEYAKLYNTFVRGLGWGYWYASKIKQLFTNGNK